MSDKLNIAALLALAKQASESDASFQLSIHNLFNLDEAIEIAEKIGGGHNEARVSTQPSCFCVSAKKGNQEVSLFVSKRDALKTRDEDADA